MAWLIEQLDQPFYKNVLDDPNPRHLRSNNIRNLPECLIDPLLPVFSQNALFDPPGKFQKRFDVWHQRYIDQLIQADHTVKRGSGYQDRRYKEYKAVFLAEYPTIREWFEAMIDKGCFPPIHLVFRGNKAQQELVQN